MSKKVVANWPNPVLYKGKVYPKGSVVPISLEEYEGLTGIKNMFKVVETQPKAKEGDKK